MGQRENSPPIIIIIGVLTISIISRLMIIHSSLALRIGRYGRFCVVSRIENASHSVCADLWQCATTKKKEKKNLSPCVKHEFGSRSVAVSRSWKYVCTLHHRRPSRGGLHGSMVIASDGGVDKAASFPVCKSGPLFAPLFIGRRFPVCRRGPGTTSWNS
uniref:Uncharacterized protein n=1 Tax=Anopheles culicifacies TaxID=139723 RepID=A0A182MJI0_9DIPT